MKLLHSTLSDQLIRQLHKQLRNKLHWLLNEQIYKQLDIKLWDLLENIHTK